MFSLSEVNPHVKLEDSESLVDENYLSTKVIDSASKERSNDAPVEQENQVVECNGGYQIAFSSDDNLFAGDVKLKFDTPLLPYNGCTTAGVNNELRGSIEDVTQLSGCIGDGNYVCDICDKQFKYKSLLKSHKMTHTGTKPFSCDRCHKTFLRKHDLQRHALIHSRTKSLACKWCEKTFAWKKDLKAHACSRAGRVNFTCDACPLTFVRKDSFKDHVLTECGTKPLCCDICGNKYVSTLHLERHMLGHDEMMNTFYRLSGCCTWESELNMWVSYPSHIYTYFIDNSIVKLEESDHDVIERGILSQVENQTVKLEESCDEHIEKHVLSKVENPTMKLEESDHIVESDIFSVINCGTSSGENNTSHDVVNQEYMRMYNENNRIDCDNDEEDFTFEVILPSNESYSSTVNKHEIIEQDTTIGDDVEKRHCCKICHKQFKYKSRLKMHSESHTGVKPFSCDKCRKKFLRKGSLHRHTCRTTKKTLLCDVCNLTFVRKDSFKDHVLTECGTKPLGCDICGMKYVSTLYLERHMLDHIAGR